MGKSLIDRWRERHAAGRGGPAPDIDGRDQEAMAELFSECELLRAQAEVAGVVLDDSVASLEALDQVLPRWRDDPQKVTWLGNDAGLYLGTVVVRTVPGATWSVPPDGQPVVRLASGREIDVVAAGHDWAAGGTPELAQIHAEAAEGH